MAIKIITDSTCDLPKGLIKKYDITIIPLWVTTGDITHKDTEITTDKLFEFVDNTNTLPKTSAPNVGEITDIIRPIATECNEVIVITISDELSSTFNNCVTASKLMDKDTKIEVITSKSLSGGTGLLVLKAVDLINDKLKFNEVVDNLIAYRESINASFVVDTLDYLKMGGRCSSASALVGGLVKVHPILKLIDGKIVATKKLRGSMKSVVNKYIDEMSDELTLSQKDRIFIVHTGVDDEIIEYVKLRLIYLFGFKQIIVANAGSVIASHCGPKTLGIMFANWVLPGEEL